MIRQAIKLNINQLRKLADDLYEEGVANDFLDYDTLEERILNRNWILPIINKTPECSDTWEFEK